MLLPITDRQKSVLECVCRFIRENNYPPTIPEIQNALHVNNPGAVHKAFCALEKKGYLIRKTGMHRGLDLTPEALKEYLQ
jgi:repressor LexA